MDYKNKYLKYKIKYINLKNKNIGGAKCIEDPTLQKNNQYYYFVSFLMLIKKYFFQKINFTPNRFFWNRNEKDRLKESTDNLFSEEFNNINDIGQSMMDLKRSIGIYHTSTSCICFNKNELKKPNNKIKFYLGGTNLKLSHPEYYYLKYKSIIDKFRISYEKEEDKIKLTLKEENIFLKFYESLCIEIILNKSSYLDGIMSLKTYNKNIFSGSKCEHGNIISNDVSKCEDSKCPYKYNIVNKEDVNITKTDDSDNDKLKFSTDLNIIQKYDAKIINSSIQCCKINNDAEIDCLLAIIRDKLNIEGTLYERILNVDNFLIKFLNPEDDEYIGNYGFFSLDKRYFPITPCHVCVNWLENYGCNYFNCQSGKLSDLFILKIKLNDWIPKSNFYKFHDELIFDDTFKYILKTSFKVLNYVKQHINIKYMIEEIFKYYPSWVITTRRIKLDKPINPKILEIMGKYRSSTEITLESRREIILKLIDHIKLYNKIKYEICLL